MNIQTFDTPHGTDSYILLTAEELPQVAAENEKALKGHGGFSHSWSGGTYEDFKRKVALGDTDLVEASEAVLTKLEDQIPHSKGWRNVDDVVGAVPNVPAMIAGHPQHMRRRERTRKDTAPLVVYMDLTSSGGINSDAVMKRGVTLLALIRVLVEYRPVELWVGASLGRYSSHHAKAKSCTTMWRIDTAPLDLSRAAYHVSATAMSRGFGYGICQTKMDSGGGWPFSNYELHCRTAQARLGAVMPGQEILYIPPIYLTDPMTTDPVGWLKRVLQITTDEVE